MRLLGWGDERWPGGHRRQPACGDPGRETAGQVAWHPVRRAAGPVERDHRRAGRAGGLPDDHRGRLGPDRGDGAAPARPRRRRRPGGGRLLRPERKRGDDRRLLDRGVRHVQRAGRDHEHARGRHRARGDHRLDRPAPSPAGGGVAAAGGRGDLRRLPERHQRPAGDRAGGDRGAGVGRGRAGRGGLGGRRHRDELLRVQGRLGYRFPAGALCRGQLHGRRVRAGQLRLDDGADAGRAAARRAAGRGRPGGGRAGARPGRRRAR